MVKLDRYIGSSVFMAIIAVLAIILGLGMLFAFIDEMGDVSDTYTLVHRPQLRAADCATPSHEMLPMAALIGCLIGLGSLARSTEAMSCAPLACPSAGSSGRRRSQCWC